jgi:hypothetical protein
MEYLGAWGALIHGKNLKSKISCQTPFQLGGAGRRVGLVLCGQGQYRPLNCPLLLSSMELKYSISSKHHKYFYITVQYILCHNP